MIEDKATERWKERMKKIGLIVNAGADKPSPKLDAMPKPKDEKAKVSKKGGEK